jgi:TrmH family RNA methyltransferase
METIKSRKNPHIVRFRALCGDRAARRAAGEYVCDGEKLLREAVENGADVRGVLWGSPPTLPLPARTKAFLVPRELLQYASPLMNSPGPLFTVGIPGKRRRTAPPGHFAEKRARTRGTSARDPDGQTPLARNL